MNPGDNIPGPVFCRQKIGMMGEEIAAEFFLRRRYLILKRNFSTPFGEIDLIVRERNGYIVFVEVKTLLSEKFGPPLTSITHKKKRHIIRNCLYYLNLRGGDTVPCRIDAVGITLDTRGNMKLLKHIKNAVWIN